MYQLSGVTKTYKKGRETVEALRGVDNIAIVRFTEKDVVRHPLVARIVGAYDARDRAARGGEEPT